MLRLCFDAHRADGIVWAVDHDGEWLLSSHVIVRVPLATVYRPNATGDEPKACLITDLDVLVNRLPSGTLIITPAL